MYFTKISKIIIKEKKKHYTFTKSFCSKEFHTREQGLPQPMRLSELWI